MGLPIGLQAAAKRYTPATFPQALACLLDQVEDIDRVDLFIHAKQAAEFSVFTPWRKPLTSAQDGMNECMEWFHNSVPNSRALELSSPIATLVALGFVLAHGVSAAALQMATTSLASAGVLQGPHYWSLMLPTTTRVTRAVYEGLVGAFYPSLVSNEGSQWTFGTGVRNTNRQEPHGFRFILWIDEYKRKAQKARKKGDPKVVETPAAISAAYEAAHSMVEFIPAYDATNPGLTPGQLIMTNTSQQRGVLSASSLSPPLPHNTRNPRYVPEEERPAVVIPGQSGGKPTKGPKGHGKGKSNEDRQDFDKLCFTHVPLRVENTVKLAGATCYRSFLVQSGVSFLSGHDQYDDRANFEAYARANVGLSRAIGATIILSPVDMRGLIGIRAQSYLDENIVTEEAMDKALEGSVIGQYPIPLCLGWLSKGPDGPRVIRLHLILVEAPWFKSPFSQHPCFPGGAFMGLLWGYAQDNQRKPLWEVRPAGHSWHSVHVRAPGRVPLRYSQPTKAHVMWSLHRGHFYDAWAHRPQFNLPDILLHGHLLTGVSEESPNQLRPSVGRPRQTEAAQGLDSSDEAFSSHHESVAESLDSATSRSSTRPSQRRKGRAKWQVVNRLPVLMEESTDLAYPSSDDVSESVLESYFQLCQAYAAFVNDYLTAGRTAKAISRCPSVDDLSQLPPEWPMGRLAFRIYVGSNLFKQNLYRATLERRLYNPRQEQAHEDDIRYALFTATSAVSSLIAEFFQGIDTSELARLAPEWQLLSTAEFWQKCLIAELASALQHSQTAGRARLDPARRTTSSLCSFLLVHDTGTDAKQGILPMRDLKAYFPMAFYSQIVKNSTRLGLLGTYEGGRADVVDLKVTAPKEGKPQNYSATVLYRPPSQQPY
eukprot:Skav225324  [mRNA]  locus=scaffold891:259200:261839:- [translate_table: standard]